MTDHEPVKYPDAWKGISRRWRCWQARMIRRRFLAGADVNRLYRAHGRKVVDAAIRERLPSSYGRS
jgi:hypothetical protein